MNFKTTLILLLAIGGLVALYFVLPEQKDVDGPTATGKLFPEHDEASVERIVIERPPGEVLTLRRSEDGWLLVLDTVEVRADADRVRDVLDPFHDMRPRRTVGEVAESKRGEYGLVPGERTTIRLEEGDGDTRELRLGRPTPQQSGSVYASVDEEGPVVIVSDRVWSAALRPESEFRDRKPVGLPLPAVKTVTLRRAEADGFRATFDEAEQTWSITALGADGEKALGRADRNAIEDLLVAVTDLRVSEGDGFVTDAPTAEELSGYGLDAPTATIRLTERDADTTREIRIGRRDGEGDEETFFWSIAGEASVYRSPVRSASGRGEGVLDRIAASVDTYRDRDLLRLGFEKADRLVLAAGERRIRLEVQKNEDQEPHWRIVEPDVKGWAQDGVVERFVADLKILTVADFADGMDPGDVGLGEGDTPAATLEVRLVDEEPRTYALGDEAEGGGRYLRRGTEDLLVVAPPELLEMIRGPWYRFRHRDLMVVQPPQGRRIDVRRGDIREVLVRGDDGKWTPSEEDGTVGAADDDAIMDLLVTFRPLRAAAPPADGFVARDTPEDPVDAAAWGLEPPAVVVRLTYLADRNEEAVVTLRVGTSIGGLHHARSEGAGAVQDSLVFALSEDAWQALNHPLLLDD